MMYIKLLVLLTIPIIAAEKKEEDTKKVSDSSQLDDWRSHLFAVANKDTFIHDVKIAPDKSFVLVRTNRDIVLYSKSESTDESLVYPIEIGDGEVCGAKSAISSDSNSIATPAHSSIFLWSSRNSGYAVPIRTFKDSSPDIYECCLFSSDGKRLVSHCNAVDYNNASIKIWDVEIGKCTDITKVSSTVLGEIAISDDENMLLLYDNYGMDLFDTRSGKQVQQLVLGSNISQAFFLSDDKYVISCGQFGIKKWELGYDKPVHIFTDAQTVAMVIDKDAAKLVTQDPCYMHVWDVQKGTHKCSLKARADYLDISSDGQEIVSAHDRGRAVTKWTKADTHKMLAAAQKQLWKKGMI